MIVYFEKKDLPLIFKVVYQNYASIEEVPRYEEYQLGLDRLDGIFQGVRSDLYASLCEKAAYLFVQINKGHFFSNGNKRLAVVIALSFLRSNDCVFKKHTKEDYQNEIKTALIDTYEFKDFPDFSPEDAAFYNLSILVADNQAYIPDFQVLKRGVENFLRFTFEMRDRN